MLRTKAAVLALLVLVGCGRSAAETFTVSLRNDLDAAVIVENSAETVEFQIAPGETHQVAYTSGSRTSWRVLGGIDGCLNVYVPHPRADVVFLMSDAGPCVTRQ